MAVDSVLPEDLVTGILLRLPVKSIIRFKCVAKKWYHLFKTPSFISQHHCLSKKMNRENRIHNVIVRYDVMRSDEYKETMLRFGNDRALDELRTEYKYQMLRFGDDGKTLVETRQDLQQQVPRHVVVGKPENRMAVGDGLICFGGVEGMTLWNPATNKFRILPDFNEYLPYKVIPYNRQFGWDGLIATSGGPCDNIQCGMDASSNDYKVLVIWTMYAGRHKYDQYAIYRMSSDSWRVLQEEEVQLINDQLFSLGASVCVNGVFYWQGLESKLLAFHLDTEVFEIIPSAGRWGELMALHDGRLSSWEWEWDCLDYFNPKSLGDAVWVMNDHGGNWTKLFNIAPPPDPGLRIMRMYGFWTHGKVFVDVDSDTHPRCLYDIETGEICELGLEGACDFTRVFIYEESLLDVVPSP